jgi:hypothetical protein
MIVFDIPVSEVIGTILPCISLSHMGLGHLLVPRDGVD